MNTARTINKERHAHQAMIDTHEEEARWAPLAPSSKPRVTAPKSWTQLMAELDRKQARQQTVTNWLVAIGIMLMFTMPMWASGLVQLLRNYGVL